MAQRRRSAGRVRRSADRVGPGTALASPTHPSTGHDVDSPFFLVSPNHRRTWMKAAIVPSVNSAWVLREVPTPEPGPNQVLIKIRASGMCYTDVHQARGEFPSPFPRTLGHEPVREIVAIGAAVTARRVGDRVGVPWVQTACGRCEGCLRGEPMFCADMPGTSMQLPGGHAEYMLAYADATMPLPDGLAFEQAPPHFAAGSPLWSGFRRPPPP